MLIADMHCDTFFVMHDARARAEALQLSENRLCVDLGKLERGGYGLQNFAMFVKLDDTADPTVRVLDMIALFDAQMEKNRARIGQVRSCAEIRENCRRGRLSALLTVEEGGVCRGETELLRRLYDRGVRMMSLTWNFENELAFPACADQTRGLKERGFAFVEEMQRLGMIVDVSHLSDAGFYDVCCTAKRPFVASHSNARAMRDHCRNLTDDMIRRLADCGGVMGLNYYGEFLCADGRSTMDQIAAHARHIADVGGVGCLALGSDFDGFDGGSELADCSAVPRLAGALRRCGFTAAEVEKIFWGNVLRVYADTIG